MRIVTHQQWDVLVCDECKSRDIEHLLDIGHPDPTYICEECARKIVPAFNRWHNDRVAEGQVKFVDPIWTFKDGKRYKPVENDGTVKQFVFYVSYKMWLEWGPGEDSHVILSRLLSSNGYGGQSGSVEVDGYTNDTVFTSYPYREDRDGKRTFLPDWRPNYE